MDGIHIVAFAEEEDPGLCLFPVGFPVVFFPCSLSLAPEGKLRFLCCCSQMAMNSWRS